MELFLALVALVQYFSISLGVGASTLALVNFLVAVSDGRIDDKERQMIGVSHALVRIAMIILLVTSLLLLSHEYGTGTIGSLATSSYAQLILVTVLYLNTMFMSAKVISSTVGPAIETASWYTLGMLAAFGSIGVTKFGMSEFIFSYLALLALAVGAVNLLMYNARQRWLKNGLPK